MKSKEIYKRGYLDGVAACSGFLIDGQDLPSIVEDMKQYVLPNRNWRKRFFEETGIHIKRRGQPRG